MSEIEKAILRNIASLGKLLVDVADVQSLVVQKLLPNELEIVNAAKNNLFELHKMKQTLESIQAELNK